MVAKQLQKDLRSINLWKNIRKEFTNEHPTRKYGVSPELLVSRPTAPKYCHICLLFQRNCNKKLEVFHQCSRLKPEESSHKLVSIFASETAVYSLQVITHWSTMHIPSVKVKQTHNVLKQETHLGIHLALIKRNNKSFAVSPCLC